MLALYVVTPRGLRGRYQRFGGKYCLHLQGWRQNVSPKSWYRPTSPHSVATRKALDIFISVRTSNLIQFYFIKTAVLYGRETQRLDV
jgi:hypothetical protein